jgi:hypothetical protein
MNRLAWQLFGRAPINTVDILLQLDPEVNKYIPKNPKPVFNLKTIRIFRQADR